MVHGHRRRNSRHLDHRYALLICDFLDSDQALFFRLLFFISLSFCIILDKAFDASQSDGIDFLIITSTSGLK